MTGFLTSLFYFLITLGALITIHEFGHFWVARRLGVKVLRFSIGFGTPLLRWKGRDGTEYVIAALPLGGYVKMLDENEGEVPPEEVHRAFNRQSVYRRTAIVLAGPLFNFLLAILAYWAMFMVGVTGVKPIIGGVEPGSLAAEAGLKPQDEIVAVEGEKTPTWESAIFALLPKVLDREPVTLTVKEPSGRVERIVLDLSKAPSKLDEKDPLGALGIRPFRPDIPPVIGKVVPGGAAERAGLKPGDRILSVDGHPMRDWEEWVHYVRAHPEKTLHVKVQRGDEVLTLTLRPKAVVDERGKTIGRIGAYVQIDAKASLPIGVLRYPPLKALGAALEKTWDMTALTLKVLAKMVTGHASLENISGPLSIAQFAGEAGSLGISPFLAFLAIVSISLGILNLLPIPVLDGGHILFYAIEMIKGSPVSEEVQAIGQRIGIALLIALMGLAFYNDLARLLGFQ
ncbi:MAG: sigma E protease regulator RseP [Gammaproteobacteria bacterium]|nr:MAG: sigma E protease regulator RseP [Gammaproteobacteria bacterium]